MCLISDISIVFTNDFLNLCSSRTKVNTAHMVTGYSGNFIEQASNLKAQSSSSLPMRQANQSDSQVWPYSRPEPPMEAKLTCYLLTPQRGPTQVRLDVHSPVAWCVLEGADNIFISLIQEGEGGCFWWQKSIFSWMQYSKAQRTNVRRLDTDNVIH